ncbi:tripartite tricarboxylate transporter substrate binding protein [Amylibacter sp. SFDW26]|uniref:Bug family tripartite tricarboxylate transporter substrate binding protein n=1 Tax=Amylibacter sp. SFDW26 TaxID=2652722 RepID=UPI0012618972|nr:tripartite tricarboxylate transporter substrate binding protein [Amylibacter sp. SFDW26]KAB7613383.1 tripartite tricarboxylate transporter substrate binding protein [Amylibacter sp. SFDW26]
MNIKLKKIALSAAIGLAALTSGMAQAETFPEKEVTVVVNYGAGGGTDLSTRSLAEAMEEALGKPLKVVNRSGGSGTVGPTFVAFADNDGYTIGVTSFSPMAVTPHMQDVPYKVDSFRYLGGFARYLTGIAVPADSPYKTTQDLIDAAKSGANIKYGAASSIESVAITRLATAAGVEFKWIRYKSGQEVSTAALSKEVDVIVGDPKEIAPFVKTGEMRAIASASNVRLPGLPDVLTLKEQGFDVATESYAGIAAPAGIDEDKAAILEAAMKEAFKAQSFQDTLTKLGLEPAYFSGAEYQKLIEDGFADMGADLAALGITKK